ncbi:hypothetical protein SAMN02745174_02636 [Cetobacterium ceti]|uniref:Uncharacterized protein n=1 Tax=Cetobacterium ceti TaxID=180163 RepID=A0A1T4RAE9_9FUSO|nr:hypothetical protein [Cetobacterium ceti]SKA12943.1 hypothetical protein SAMN02745174_02636 [Cetobacterium ceti]
MPKFITEKFFKTYFYNKDSSDWEKAIFTREEFKELESKLIKTNTSLQDCSKELDFFKNQKINLEIKIKELQEQLIEFENIKTENKNLNNLNQNLLRICKERANAKRKLMPKKTHHGYIKKHAEQYIYKFTDHTVVNGRRFTNEKFLDLWKSIVQSPYSLEISSNKVLSLITNDLKSFKIEFVNIKDFSTWNKLSLFSYNKLDSIVIYEIKLKENLKDYLWEFQVLSNIQLDF